MNQHADLTPNLTICDHSSSFFFFLLQTCHGQLTWTVTLHCSRHPHLSPPLHLPRTQTMTPGELWEGTKQLQLLFVPPDCLLISRISFYWATSCLTLIFFFPPFYKSRASTGRERSDKPLISAAPSARPGPFVRGGSSKELLESQSPEEPRRDREREGAEPRRPSVTEDKTEMERSRVREPGENTAQPLQFTYFIQFSGENKRSPEFLVLTK